MKKCNSFCEGEIKLVNWEQIYNKINIHSWVTKESQQKHILLSQE
jgi:hypothetical protein